MPAGLKCYASFAMAGQDETAFKCPHKFNIDRFKDKAEMVSEKVGMIESKREG